MAELLAILIIGYAIKAMISDTKTASQARRAKHGGKASLHGVAYWLHQAAHLFPAARNSFMSGWHRGRNAHHQATIAMQKARTEHAEQRVKIGPELAAYRGRRKDALDELERQRQQRAKDAYRDLDEQQPPPPDPDASPYTYQPPTASFVPRQQPGNGTSPQPSDDPQDNNQNSQGDNTMTETTYAGVKTRMQQDTATAEQQAADAKSAEAGAEQRVQKADQAKAWASNTADEMQSLEVDADTLGAMGEHLDALEAAKVAEENLLEAVTAAHAGWNRVTETAGQVSGALEAGGHGALDEAHANAAAGGAQKDFYQE